MTTWQRRFGRKSGFGLFGFGLALMSAAVLTAPSCGRKNDVKLPPAKGEGAAPMPELPAVGATGEGATSESATVAPTDGRTTGTTFPRAEAQIGPNAGGVIAKIYVKEGDKVRRGMVLFRQLTRDAELRVEQAKAALASARVNVKATEVELTRTKGMFEQKAVSQMEWDQVQARTDGARAGIQQAEVALAIAQKMLADCTVRSPIAGVVTAKLKSEGEMATMMPPTVVLVVQDQSALELRFHLPEGSVGGVKVGQFVDVAFEAVGVKRRAKIMRIQSAVDSRTRTIEVVAEIPNADGALRSGLLASVSLTSADAGVAVTSTPPPSGAKPTGGSGAVGAGQVNPPAPPRPSATAAVGEGRPQEGKGP